MVCTASSISIDKRHNTSTNKKNSFNHFRDDRARANENGIRHECIRSPHTHTQCVFLCTLWCGCGAQIDARYRYIVVHCIWCAVAVALSPLHSRRYLRNDEEKPTKKKDRERQRQRMKWRREEEKKILSETISRLETSTWKPFNGDGSNEIHEMMHLKQHFAYLFSGFIQPFRSLWLCLSVLSHSVYKSSSQCARLLTHLINVAVVVGCESATILFFIRIWRIFSFFFHPSSMNFIDAFHFILSEFCLSFMLLLGAVRQSRNALR